jgi:hypothetical protein
MLLYREDLGNPFLLPANNEAIAQQLKLEL